MTYSSKTDKVFSEYARTPLRVLVYRGSMGGGISLLTKIGIRKARCLRRKGEAFP